MTEKKIRIVELCNDNESKAVKSLPIGAVIGSLRSGSWDDVAKDDGIVYKIAEDENKRPICGKVSYFVSPLMDYVPQGREFNRLSAYLHQTTAVTEVEMESFYRSNTRGGWMHTFDDPKVAPILEFITKTYGIKFDGEQEDVANTRFSAHVHVLDSLSDVDGTGYRVVSELGPKPVGYKADGFAFHADGVSVIKGMILEITPDECCAFKIKNPVIGDVYVGPDTIKRLGADSSKTEMDMNFFHVSGEYVTCNNRSSLSRQVWENAPDNVREVLANVINTPAYGAVMGGGRVKLRGKLVRFGKAFGLPKPENWEVDGPTVYLPKDKNLDAASDVSAIIWRYPSDGGIVVANVKTWDRPYLGAYGIDAALGGDYDGDAYYLALVKSSAIAVGEYFPNFGHDKHHVNETEPDAESYKFMASMVGINEEDHDKLLETLSPAGIERYHMWLISEFGDVAIGRAMNQLKLNRLIEAYSTGNTYTGLQPSDWTVIHGIIHAQKKPLDVDIIAPFKRALRVTSNFKSANETLYNEFVSALSNKESRPLSPTVRPIMPSLYAEWESLVRSVYLRQLEKYGMSSIGDPQSQLPQHRGVVTIINAMASFLMDYDGRYGKALKCNHKNPVDRLRWLMSCMRAGMYLEDREFFANLLPNPSDSEHRVREENSIAFLRKLITKENYPNLLLYLAYLRFGQPILYVLAGNSDAIYSILNSIYMVSDKGIADHLASLGLDDLLESILTGVEVEFHLFDDNNNMEVFSSLSGLTLQHHWNIFVTADGKVREYPNEITGLSSKVAIYILFEAVSSGKYMNDARVSTVIRNANHAEAKLNKVK